MGWIHTQETEEVIARSKIALLLPGFENRLAELTELSRCPEHRTEKIGIDESDAEQAQIDTSGSGLAKEIAEWRCFTDAVLTGQI